MAESSVFECGICLIRYNAQDRQPLSLPCGHVYCKLCLKHLEKCPVDNSAFTFDRLPVCYAITVNLSKMSGVPCSRHPRKRVKFMCKTHSCYLCSDCVLDHTGKSHETVSFSPNIEQMRQEIQGLAVASEEILNKARSTDQSSRQTSKKVIAHYDAQIAKIKTSYDNCIKALVAKRKEHVEYLNSTLKEQLKDLEKHKNLSGKLTENALALSDSLKDFLDDFTCFSYEEYISLLNSKREEIKAFSYPNFEPKFVVFNEALEIKDTSSLSVVKSESRIDKSKTDMGSSQITSAPTKKTNPPVKKAVHINKHKQRLTNRIPPTNNSF